MSQSNGEGNLGGFLKTLESTERYYAAQSLQATRGQDPEIRRQDLARTFAGTGIEIPKTLFK